MSRERILTTLIAAATLLLLFGVVKPLSPDPVENSTTTKTWFFINKTHQAANYDLVVVGDSRALRGVAPSIMRETLSEMRIFNFAFHAGGLNPEI